MVARRTILPHTVWPVLARRWLQCVLARQSSGEAAQCLVHTVCCTVFSSSVHSADCSSVKTVYCSLVHTALTTVCTKQLGSAAATTHWDTRRQVVRAPSAKFTY